MWFSLILFIAILFLYIHLQNQYKFNDDIQIYEVMYQNKKQFTNACELRQPFISTLQDIVPLHSTILHKYTDIEYNIKNTNDLVTSTNIDTVALSYSQAFVLLDTDQKSHFFSERNYDNQIVREISHVWDQYLKPPQTIHSTYDVLFGSKDTQTPFMFHHSTSKFLFISEKEVKVQMYPFSDCYHDYNSDYEFFEFWTHTKHFKKSPPVEFWVYPGQILYIPPYVFYSIQFKNPNTIICTAEYTTMLNSLANAKHWTLYTMQQQNLDIRSFKPFQSVLPEFLSYSTNQSTEELVLTNSVESTTNDTTDKIDISGNDNTLSTTTQDDISKEFVDALKHQQ